MLFVVLIACVSMVISTDPCSEHLVTGPFGVPDDHITASSTKVPKDPNLYTGPERARLYTNATKLANGTVLMGAWTPAQNNKKEYIQVELNDYSLVKGLMTQGRNLLPSDPCCVEYVALFHVETSIDGQNWTRITENGKDKTFVGNVDSDTVVNNMFPCPIFAKYVRVIPEAWSQNISLRFDALGCQIDNSKPQATPAAATPVVTTGTTQAPTSTQAQTQQPTTTTTATTTTTSVVSSATPLQIATQAAKGQCINPVTGCKNLKDGDYKECGTCSTYATCSNGILYAHRPCPWGLQWNDGVKKCQAASAFTCI